MSVMALSEGSGVRAAVMMFARARVEVRSREV